VTKQAQTKATGAPDPGNDTRIAPDPVAILLPALSALASIAALAALAFVAEEKTDDRQRNRRKLSVAIRDLERDAVDLQELFKRISRGYGALLWERGAGKPGGPPLKFGVHGLRIPQRNYSQYQSLVADSSALLSRTAQDSFDVMCAIEDGELEAPEEVFFGFGEAQERINKLLTERLSLKTSVETGHEIAGRLTALVRDLKQYKKD